MSDLRHRDDRTQDTDRNDRTQNTDRDDHTQDTDRDDHIQDTDRDDRTQDTDGDSAHGKHTSLQDLQTLGEPSPSQEEETVIHCRQLLFRAVNTTIWSIITCYRAFCPETSC